MILVGLLQLLDVRALLTAGKKIRDGRESRRERWKRRVTETHAGMEMRSGCRGRRDRMWGD